MTSGVRLASWLLLTSLWALTGCDQQSVWSGNASVDGGEFVNFTEDFPMAGASFFPRLAKGRSKSDFACESQSDLACRKIYSSRCFGVATRVVLTVQVHKFAGFNVYDLLANIRGAVTQAF